MPMAAAVRKKTGEDLAHPCEDLHLRVEAGEEEVETRGSGG